MKGVPLRLEIGPKDIEKNQCVLVERPNRKKTIVQLESLEDGVSDCLKGVKETLYQNAKQRLISMTKHAKDFDEFEALAKEPGLIKAMWCGSRECEDKVKEKFAITSRCIPFEQEQLSQKCCFCKQQAKFSVYWGRSY
jgi:prolyl-tRNA synthetase